MPTFINGASRGAGTNIRKLAPMGAHGVAEKLTMPGNTNSYLGGDCPRLDGGIECQAGATVISGASAVIVGGSTRIYVAGSSTQGGTLYVDTSTDGGATWSASDSDAVIGGEVVIGVLNTSAGENRYRLRFVCGPVGTRLNFGSNVY